MSTSKEFELLDRCRRDLHAGRTEARAAARRLEDEMMQPLQDATDIAVTRALAAGATKSAVAAALGESRVTINQRLERMGGGHAEAAVEIYKTENPVYKIEDGHLHVEWDNYGPGGVTGSGTYQIVKDETGGYWFMETGASDAEVDQYLDTVFNGWYYEDAAKFVAWKMEEE